MLIFFNKNPLHEIFLYKSKKATSTLYKSRRRKVKEYRKLLVTVLTGSIGTWLSEKLYHNQMVRVSLQIICISFALQSVSAFFFDGHHQQQQQQGHNDQDAMTYQQRFLDNGCPHYLCPETLACVKKESDCPCPFPNSQLKCQLPNGRRVCISKPATHDAALNDIYDDPVKGPMQRTDGLRDCGWVLDAYQGKV